MLHAASVISPTCFQNLNVHQMYKQAQMGQAAACSGGFLVLTDQRRGSSLRQAGGQRGLEGSTATEHLLGTRPMLSSGIPA